MGNGHSQHSLLILDGHFSPWQIQCSHPSLYFPSKWESNFISTKNNKNKCIGMCALHLSISPPPIEYNAKWPNQFPCYFHFHSFVNDHKWQPPPEGRWPSPCSRRPYVHFLCPFNALSTPHFFSHFFPSMPQIWLLLPFSLILCLGGRPLDRLTGSLLALLGPVILLLPAGRLSLLLRQRPSTGPFIPLDGGRPMARRVFRRAPSFSNRGPVSPLSVGVFPFLVQHSQSTHQRPPIQTEIGERSIPSIFPFSQFLSIYGQFFQSPGKKFANFFGKKNSRNWLKFVGLFLSKNMPKNTISIGQFMDLSITKWLKRIPSYSLSIN